MHTKKKTHVCGHGNIDRLGKVVSCSRVNDDRKIDVDDKNKNSGRPHDDCILERLSYNTLIIFLLLLKRNILEDDYKWLWTTFFFFNLNTRFGREIF